MKRGSRPEGLGVYNSGMKRIAAPLLALLAACASAPAPTDAEKIRVYESVTGAPQVGAIVKRLWIESWSTAFFAPSYASVEEGAADLQRHAARLGGDGVINFGCYRMGEAADAALRCNGTVVRFK
jgi:hypothetical protein